MKTLALTALLTLTAALAGIAAAAPSLSDPRVCDQFNTQGAATHARMCADQASSILVWKMEAKKSGVITFAYAPTCAPTTKTLQYRCYLDHARTSSGPAVLVTWDATFAPKLVFGSCATGWLAAVKQRAAAAAAADAAGETLDADSLPPLPRTCG